MKHSECVFYGRKKDTAVRRMYVSFVAEVPGISVTGLGSHSCSVPLVRRRLLDVVDHQHFDRRFLWFKLQPELLLQRLAKGSAE